MIHCILFDIGNTLILDDGTQSGRMLEWQQLTSLPGAVEAVRMISRQIPCYGASNAGDSSNEEALQALQKAGFSDSITRVFTRHSLGVSKEEPSFYRQICETLGYPPSEVLMIGDHPVQDVLVPGEAGLQTCFYNPQGLPQHSALLPLQNAEFSSFEHLKARINEGLHPSYGDCIAWLVQNGTTQGILQHVLMVAAVAYAIALRFVQSNTAVDPILIHRSALVHDIDKLHPSSSRERHGKLGAELLEEKGLLQMAEIVRYHVPPDLWSLGNNPNTWEQKIVFYADKLVKHNTLVLMEDRIRDLIVRYPENKTSYIDNLPTMILLEREIMDVIGDEPESFHAWMKVQLTGRPLSG